MQLLPDSLKNTIMSVEVKRFLQALKNRLPDEYTGIYGVNLTGQPGDEHFMLISAAGLVVMRFFDMELDTSNTMLLKVFSANFQTICSTIQSRLITHSILKDRKQLLLFPLRVLYVFTGSSQFPAASDQADQLFIDKCLRTGAWLAEARKSAIATFEKLLSESDNKVSAEAIRLSQGHIDTIINRLAPWCTIPKLPADAYVAPTKVLPGIKVNLLDHSDSLVEVLRLDREQVDLVNSIKNGHQLILACAGSGKSAILIARCFKLASMDHSKNYLITCYNSNLREYYRWQIDEAGLAECNVQCMTFHALCRKIILDAGQTLPPEVDAWFSKANDIVRSGKVKTRYYGIFIDEVQIFMPGWYQLCLKLLESQKPEEHVLAISGDITQDIKKTIKQSKAPWQGEGLPSYSGRTLHIEKNYRNCVPINQFINSYATAAMSYLENIEGAITQDTFLRGKAVRPGNMPELVEYHSRDARIEADEICKCIKKMHDEQAIGYTDIAVLLYNQFGFIDGWKYNILGLLRVALNQYHIEWTELSWKNHAEIITYQSRRGVSVMTYEGALGLDYRGVIVAGIPTVGAHSGTYKLNRVSVMSEDETMREDYVQGFKSLYLACTRAKDSLMMVVPAPNVFVSDYTRVIIDAYQAFSEEATRDES